MPCRGPILLVEDDDDDVFFTSRAFGMAGCRSPLAVVRDGDQAVDYLAGQGEYADRASCPMPVHVLMDLKLPKRSGLEVLRWIRENPVTSTLPVTILSGSGQDADIAEARALGVEDYVRKPVTFEGLLCFMREFCRRESLE